MMVSAIQDLSYRISVGPSLLHLKVVEACLRHIDNKLAQKPGIVSELSTLAS
jgi:hypothetical protein